MNKFQKLCMDARRKGTFVSSSNVYSLWTQYSDDEMVLFDCNGRHFLSYGDVVPESVMSFVWKSAKKLLGPDSDFLCSIDAFDYSPLHYAAINQLNDVFYGIPPSENAPYKKMFRHVNIDTRHSVASLLVERDRADLLKHLVKSLHLSPFTSDFQDIYVSWLHDAIFCNAKSVAVYLYKEHRESLRLSLLRRTRNQFEYVTPMDAVLLSKHGKDRHFFVDVILWNMEQGMKLESVPFSHILLDEHLSEMSTKHDIKTRCISDSLLNRLGIR